MFVLSQDAYKARYDLRKIWSKVLWHWNINSYIQTLKKITGEAPKVCPDKTKPSWTLSEHQSAQISFRINQHQSESISINWNLSQHQSSFVIDLEPLYTGINAQNFWGAWGGYREILRSVRRLCEKVVRGRLQELLSELTISQWWWCWR